MTTALASSAHITTRYLRAFLRQPYYIAGTLVQPVIWLLLFGQLFKRVVEIPGFTAGSYIAFLTPGIVVMSAMLSTGWSGTSYVIDMERGVMNRFLVSPVRRGALIGGELVYQASMVLLQSLIILGLGFLAGARFNGGIASIIILLVGTMLLGTAFASLSNALALILRKQESVIAANVTLVLPLTFLSSTFLPVSLMPPWMQHFARFNPVNWAVEVGRQTLSGSIDWSLVGSHLAGLLALTLVCAWLSARAFRAYQRSV
ncbi:MAG TPA: ABC transporter permease [Ktedonobacterales bacterium]|nr:ABC transporter permease [Ktedonobacterales bacterium]